MADTDIPVSNPIHESRYPGQLPLVQKLQGGKPYLLRVGATGSAAASPWFVRAHLIGAVLRP